MNMRMLIVKLTFSSPEKHRLMAWPDKPSRITVFIFCGGGEVRDITRSRFRFRPSIIRLPRLTFLMLSLEPPGIKSNSHWSGLQLFKLP